MITTINEFKLILESFSESEIKNKIKTYQAKYYTQYAVIDAILNQAYDTIVNSIVKSIEYEIKNNRNVNDFLIEYLYANAVYKLILTLSKYIDKNDAIKNINTQLQAHKLIVNCLVIRNNHEYPLSTEMILAGGYNIQSLHYRYIVKSQLRKIETEDPSLPIKDRIKNLSKKESEMQTLRQYQFYVKNTQSDLEELENMSEDDVWNKTLYKTWTYDSHRGNKTLDEFNDFMANIKQEELQKHQNKIKFTKNRIKELIDKVNKIQSKIDSL